MRRNTIFWGALLILFGLLLLLDNAGIFGNVDIWDLIWPIFLIFLGIWILFNYFNRSKSELRQLTLPAGTAEKANIRFDYGGGRIFIKAGPNQEDLISGEFGGGVEYSVDTIQEETNIVLRIPQRWFPFLWIPGTSSLTSWKVALKPNYPLSLSFNTGAGETNVDLQGLIVHKVVLKTGASSTKIIMPDQAEYTGLRVEAGVASVDIHIPESVAARIRTSVGLASVNIDMSRFPKRGGIYISNDYDTAENKVDIDISSGVSSISIN